jgi:hypothetical protein
MTAPWSMHSRPCRDLQCETKCCSSVTAAPSFWRFLLARASSQPYTCLCVVTRTATDGGLSPNHAAGTRNSNAVWGQQPYRTRDSDRFSNKPDPQLTWDFGRVPIDDMSYFSVSLHTLLDLGVVYNSTDDASVSFQSCSGRYVVVLVENS